ncbi:hypothetical protein EVAR_65228_1 [Eumeta japonica]|uniref:Uncharacterized protein n=1 Tax=Eumeta variegata TaxID=151549 RepID=A0A4C1ZB27_EUMVA|nr:hypothetical protein EVAR_65228_1 [Eumeta japonica]
MIAVISAGTHPNGKAKRRHDVMIKGETEINVRDKGGTDRKNVRREALKALLLDDFIKEDMELKKQGLAYASPDP